MAALFVWQCAYLCHSGPQPCFGSQTLRRLSEFELCSALLAPTCKLPAATLDLRCYIPCLLPCLCRQPPPRDSPEHGAALQLFLQTAYEEVRNECGTLQGHTSGACSRLLKAMQCSIAGDAPSQRNSRSGDSVRVLPPASEARSWALVPHVDLQLQVPPQLLLQQLVQLQEEAQKPHSRLRPQSKLGHLVDLLASGPLAVLDALLPITLRKAVRQQLGSPAQQAQQQLPGGSVGNSQHQQQPAQQTTGQAEAAAPVSDARVMSCVASVLQPASDGQFSLEVAGNITSLAYALLLSFLQVQLQCAGGTDSVQWQQAVPLQALHLLATVRQLEAAGQAAVSAAAAGNQEASAPDPWAVPADAGGSEEAADDAQRQIVHLLLGLLQQVRHFEDCNAAHSADGSQGSSSSSRQQTVQERYEGSPPDKSFAADGQFCSFLLPEQRSMGLGVWWKPELQGCASPAPPAAAATGLAAAAASEAAEPGCDGGSSGGSAGSCGSPQQLAAAASSKQQKHVAQVLHATALQFDALARLDAELLRYLMHGQDLQQHMQAVTADMVASLIRSRPELVQDLQQVQQFLCSQGIDLSDLEPLAACALQSGQLAACLHERRQHLLQQSCVGCAADAWENHIDAAGGLSGLQQRQHSAGSLAPRSDWDEWGDIWASTQDIGLEDGANQAAEAAYFTRMRVAIGQSSLW